VDRDGRFTLEPGTKVLHDFSTPTGWQLPPARSSVSEMIATRDTQGLTDLVEKEMGHYSPPGIHHRIEALLTDGLINDSEFEQLLAHRNPNNLERMLNRLETNEREELRAKRIETATFEDIEHEFPNEIATMPFNIREGLERLLDTGGIDPEEVRECLREGREDVLEREIVLREHLAEHERERETGRVR
jgi:hypothetical protein